MFNFNLDIKNILQSELLEENILVSSIKYTNLEEIENNISKLDLIKDHFIKYLDTKLLKYIVWHFLVLKDKLNSGSKMIKNIVLISWIIVSIVFLYSILSTVVWVTTQNNEVELAKGNIIKAQKKAKQIGVDPNLWRSIEVTLPKVTGKHSKETITYVKKIQTIKQELK